MADSYRHPPGWFTRRVFNPAVAWFTRRGMSLAGSRVLEVRGRKSGEPRQTPVNPLNVEGADYLVAPRGNTQWVRNLRFRGEGRLIAGKKSVNFTSVEIGDDDKSPILREYLKKWKWEVGAFFEGVDADAAEEDLRAVAPDHPVFRITISGT